RHVAHASREEGSVVRVGERVGKLDPESPTAGFRLGVEGGDQLERVGELEVALEVVAMYLDAPPSGLVEDGSGRIVAEEGGVELDEGVQALGLDEVGADALDLVGRAAVHGREGRRVDWRGGKIGEERARGGKMSGTEGGTEGLGLDEGLEIAHRALPEFRLGGRAHSLDEGVHPGALDPLEGI